MWICPFPSLNTATWYNKKYVSFSEGQSYSSMMKDECLSAKYQLDVYISLRKGRKKITFYDIMYFLFFLEKFCIFSHPSTFNCFFFFSVLYSFSRVYLWFVKFFFANPTHTFFVILSKLNPYQKLNSEPLAN